MQKQKTCANWEQLRHDMFVSPSGEAKDILSAVHSFLPYYSEMPIEDLRQFFNRLKKGPYKDKQSFFIDAYYRQPLPDLPNYSRIDDRMVETPVGMPRINKWNFDVNVLFMDTQKNWKRPAYFRIIVRNKYMRQHITELPVDKLDTYACAPEFQLKFKRVGDFSQINDKFLYSTRELIVDAIYRIKKMKVCQQVVGTIYKKRCGSRCEGTKCPHCSKLSMNKYVKGILKN